MQTRCSSSARGPMTTAQVALVLCGSTHIYLEGTHKHIRLGWLSTSYSSRVIPKIPLYLLHFFTELMMVCLCVRTQNRFIFFFFNWLHTDYATLGGRHNWFNHPPTTLKTSMADFCHYEQGDRERLTCMRLSISRECAPISGDAGSMCCRVWWVLPQGALQKSISSRIKTKSLMNTFEFLPGLIKAACWLITFLLCMFS